MSAAMLAIAFSAGFVIMTPIGPVSTICIRRALMYGRLAGIVAGAGDAVAVAAYATLGVAGGSLVPHMFANFATAWHVVISVVLVLVAIMLWRARPTLPKLAARTAVDLAGGFGATLGLALLNPADIALFAALFAGLGVVVRTPVEYTLFGAAVFAGGLVYWIAMAFLLAKWRTALTIGRMRWLNRGCAAFMFAGAIASVASLVQTGN